MGGVGAGAPVYALPGTIEVVEAVVLLVNDDEVADLRERVVAQAVGSIRIGSRRQRLRADGNYHASPEHHENSCCIQELRADHNYLLKSSSVGSVYRSPC